MQTIIQNTNNKQQQQKNIPSLEIFHPEMGNRIAIHAHPFSF